MLLIPVEVRHSPIHGLGVFASQSIREGARVWQFDPGVDQRKPVEWLETQPEHVRRFIDMYSVLSLDKQYYYLVGDQTLFVNHSFTPNLEPRDDVHVNEEGVIVAARNIAAGEELTINYAEIDGVDREKTALGRPLFEAPAARSRA